MITQLTSAQLAMLPAIAAEWTAIGRCTDPADRPAAEAAIRQMYAQAKLVEPRIVWTTSPLAQGITRAVVRDAGASVRASVGDSVRDSVWDSVGDSVYGSHDAAWLAYYDAMCRIVGLVSQTAPFAGLWALARSAGWALPHSGVCWISERHDRLRWDTAGRLHCENGPAIRYPDGWGVHLWHGTRVPAAWIEERATLTAQTALTWVNVEQRRAACEILGWDAVLAETHAVVVEQDADPSIGTLLRADLPDAPGSQFLRVRCATGREFVLSVPADVRTAREANASTWGLGPDEYSPAVQA